MGSLSGRSARWRATIDLVTATDALACNFPRLAICTSVPFLAAKRLATKRLATKRGLLAVLATGRTRN